MGNIGAAATMAVHGGPVVFKCTGPDGRDKWTVIEPKNLVVNAGLQKLLDVGLIGSTAVATWYLGLIGTSGTIASGDTMASHAGWTERTNYGTATRAIFAGVRTDEAVTNSASTVSYAINTAGSIQGAFLVSDSTKGGSLGTLLCEVSFTAGDKAVTDGDTLTITYTVSMADA